MALGSRILKATEALLGLSAFAPAASGSQAYTLDSDMVKRVREALGGQLQPIPFTKSHWFQADLESAVHASDAGDMTIVGQLWRSMKRDGYISGLSETRTAGLIALPKRWRGNEALVAKLRADSSGTRSYFEDLCPTSELAQIAADGLACGVGVGEMLPVRGRNFPKLVRQDPEFLRFRWNEQRWYYQSVAGPVPVTPGNGWVLHTPGGIIAPWQSGLWPSLGRAFVTKEHAMLHRGNFSGKLANPARLAFAPQGATEEQRVGFLSRLIAWGINSVFELPPGWDAKLLESNGRGWEVFGAEIDTANQEIMIALAGQFVTVTGGTGFANADIHETIRADLIKRTGDAVAHTVNTQILPQWAFGEDEDSLDDPPRFEWDTSPPQDQKAQADAMGAGADALKKLHAVLTDLGIKLDAHEITSRFGWPILEGKPDAVAALVLTPSDIAAVVTVDQALESVGLPARGGKEGGMTVLAYRQSLEAPAGAGPGVSNNVSPES